MIPSKLTIPLALTILMLGASAAPVTGPDSKVPGPRPQKRGYDGDWLFSRESELVKPLVAEGKMVAVDKRDGGAIASAAGPSLSTAKQS